MAGGRLTLSTLMEAVLPVESTAHIMCHSSHSLVVGSVFVLCGLAVNWCNICFDWKRGWVI